MSSFLRQVLLRCRSYVVGEVTQLFWQPELWSFAKLSTPGSIKLSGWGLGGALNQRDYYWDIYGPVLWLLICLVAFCFWAHVWECRSQSYGINLHNSPSSWLKEMRPPRASVMPDYVMDCYVSKGETWISVWNYVSASQFFLVNVWVANVNTWHFVACECQWGLMLGASRLNHQWIRGDWL